MRLNSDNFSAKIMDYKIKGSWSDISVTCSSLICYNENQDSFPPSIPPPDILFRVSCDPLFTLQEINVPKAEDITIESNRFVYRGGLCLETTKMVFTGVVSSIDKELLSEHIYHDYDCATINYKVLGETTISTEYRRIVI